MVWNSLGYRVVLGCVRTSNRSVSFHPLSLSILNFDLTGNSEILVNVLFMVYGGMLYAI